MLPYQDFWKLIANHDFEKSGSSNHWVFLPLMNQQTFLGALLTSFCLATHCPYFHGHLLHWNTYFVSTRKENWLGRRETQTKKSSPRKIWKIDMRISLKWHIGNHATLVNMNIDYRIDRPENLFNISNQLMIPVDCILKRPH